MSRHFRGITLMLFLLLSATISHSQEVEEVLPKWNYIGDSKASLYKYFAGQAFQVLNRRKAIVSAYSSKKSWLQRQDHVRKAYAAILGQFPAKTPLNSVVTGVSEQDGVRVEKVYFESLPGYYVTAALFLPLDRKGKLPAIVYCSGHSSSGFRSRPYQNVILNLVKKGFAVLAFDPIGIGERRQYANNEKRKDSFGPTQEHSYPGSQHFLLGRSPAYYFIWDGIRAIDYLCSRPEIDTNRIGVTGRSGGGTQTVYIAAFDNRVKAAAPECYITSQEKLLMTRGPQDAEQNFAGSIAAGLDIGDLLLCFAPKPLLMVTTTRDIFNIQGARDVFSEVKHAYSYFGKPGNISMAEDDAEHTSTLKNREATYRFFQNFLNNPGASEEVPVNAFANEALQVTSSGNVYSSLKGQDLHSLAALHLKEVLQKRTPVAEYGDLVNRVEKATGFKRQPMPESPVFSGRYHRKGYVVESYILKSITGSYCPVYWLKPLDSKIKRPPVLLLDDYGKAEAIKEGGRADSLVKMGYEIVVPDLSGFGELATGYIKGADSWVDKIPLNLWYTAILMKQSLLTVRMYELSFLIDWINQSGAGINAIAKGVLTTDLLHIAFLRSKDFISVSLIDPLVSYQSLVEAAAYKTGYLMSAVPGMIAQYDMYDLIRFFPEKNRLLLINARKGNGEVIKDVGHYLHLDLKGKYLVEYGDAPFSLIGDWYSNTPADRR